mgnify:CR=1 FL=1
MCGVSMGGIYIEKKSNYRQDIIFMLRLNSFFLLLFPFCKPRYGIQLFDKALHPFTDLCFGCKNQLSTKALSNFSVIPAFVSPRSPVNGSPFIRGLVIAMNRFASQHHLEDIAGMVRDVVADRCSWFCKSDALSFEFGKRHSMNKANK